MSFIYSKFVVLNPVNMLSHFLLQRDKIRCKAAVDEQIPPAGNEGHLCAEGMDRRGLCHDLLMMHMLEIDTDVQSRR